MTDKDINSKGCRYCLNHYRENPYFNDKPCKNWSLCNLFISREMDSSIIDSSILTNKQKKAIRKEFNEYANCPNKGEVTRIFIWLFGKEFFKKKEK